MGIYKQTFRACRYLRSLSGWASPHTPRKLPVRRSRYLRSLPGWAVVRQRLVDE